MSHFADWNTRWHSSDFTASYWLASSFCWSASFFGLADYGAERDPRGGGQFGLRFRLFGRRKDAQACE